jgi:hypothetical protein
LKSVQNKIEVTSTLIIIILKIKLIEIHSKKIMLLDHTGENLPVIEIGMRMGRF